MHILSNCTANIWEPILLIYLPKKQHTQPPGMSPTISQNLQMLILYLNIFWGSYHYRTQQTMIFFLMNNTHSVNRLKTLTSPHFLFIHPQKQHTLFPGAATISRIYKYQRGARLRMDPDGWTSELSVFVSI